MKKICEKHETYFIENVLNIHIKIFIDVSFCALTIEIMIHQ